MREAASESRALSRPSRAAVVYMCLGGQKSDPDSDSRAEDQADEAPAKFRPSHLSSLEKGRELLKEVLHQARDPPTSSASSQLK